MYRARDVLLERDVALTVLDDATEFDQSIQDHLIKRGWAGPGLSHPNIEILYDAGEDQGKIYVVTEFLAGADLQSGFQDPVRLSLLRKLNVIAQIYDGIAHAHQHGIPHLGIRPSNLFVDYGKRAKLIGFGIRRKVNLVERGKTDSDSARYMAPEQIAGFPGDSRSDLFSAATVFREYLVGSLRDVDSLIPADVEKSLSNSLAIDPAERTIKAEELAWEVRKAERQLRSSYLSARGLVSLPSEASLGLSTLDPGEEVRQRREDAPRLRFTSLQKQLAATAAIALVLVISALFAREIRKAPAEKLLGTSRVQANNTVLLDAPAVSGRKLATLKAGDRVSILEPIRTQDQKFIRVQATDEDKRLLQGYVPTYDLSQWTSNDAEVEWGFLNFQKPAPGSADTETKLYVDALINYRQRFPASAHGQQADAEITKLLQSLDNSSAPVASTVPSALPASPPVASNKQPNPAVIAQDLNALISSLPGLWEQGDLDGLMASTQKILSADPANAQAKAWRLKTRKAMRRLAGDEQ